MVRLSKSDATMGRDSPDSVELVSEDDNDYEVEDIISHRKVRNNILYTVSWVGYKDENTEIAEEDLAGASQLLVEYKKKHNLDTKAPSSRSRSTKNSDNKRRRNVGKDPEDSSRSLSIISLEDEVNPDANTPRRSTRNKTGGGEGIEMRSSRLRSAKRNRPDDSHTPDGSLTPSRTTRNTSKAASGKKRLTESDDDASLQSIKNVNRPNRETSNKKSNERLDWLMEDSDSERNNNAALPVGSQSSRQQHNMIVFPSPSIGLFNNIEVSHVSGLKCEGGKKSVKVFYTPPVPEPFKSFDVIDTRFVRYYAPQKLIDLYENLLTAD